MTPDEVIDRRKLWSQYNFRGLLPEATVLAEHDWLAYVQAMATTVPDTEEILWPTETEVAWAWPDGVAIVLAEPLTMNHTIVSREGPDGKPYSVEPVQEQQTVGGVIVGPMMGMTGHTPEGEPVPDVQARPVLWIGADPSDIISAHWIPGLKMRASAGYGVSESTRFLVSAVTALGHRLTHVVTPRGTRGERRRAARELPSLRVLELSSGASVTRSDETHSVEWSKRWMVRGHWRLQPYGRRREQRKMRWIDPYVKGPEDKPLDVRPTIWRTPPNE